MLLLQQRQLSLLEEQQLRSPTSPRMVLYINENRDTVDRSAQGSPATSNGSHSNPRQLLHQQHLVPYLSNVARKSSNSIANEHLSKTKASRDCTKDSSQSTIVAGVDNRMDSLTTDNDNSSKKAVVFKLKLIIKITMIIKSWWNAVVGKQKSGQVEQDELDKFGIEFVDRFSMVSVEQSLASNVDSKSVFKRLVLKSVNPSKGFYYYFTLLLAVCWLYNAMAIVARCTFTDFQLQFTGACLACDYLADLVYIIDILVQSKKAYLEDGILVTDARLLAQKHLFSFGFVVQVVSVLPTDLLYLYVGINNPIVRINRLLPVNRILDFCNLTEMRTSWTNSFRIFKLVLSCFIMFHWNSCLYFLLSKRYGIHADRWVFNYERIVDPVVSGNRSIRFSNLVKQIVFCSYWSALTMTGIGQQDDPDPTEQYAFEIFDILGGFLIFATIVGSVGAMITNVNAEQTEFQEFTDGIKQYMDYRMVHPALKRRIKKWFAYVRTQKLTLSEDAITDVLPSKLKAELAIQVHMDTLKRVAIFQDCEAGLLQELVLKLKLQIFCPRDYICCKGDVGKEMYIVKRGTLQVVSVDGAKILASLHEGSVFGELSVLDVPGNKNGNRRTANVRSVGYSDLFVLSKGDLWETLREFPDAKSQMLAKGRQILLKDDLLDQSGPSELELLVKERSVEHKLDRVQQQLADIDSTISGLYCAFVEQSGAVKSRLANLEQVLKASKQLIKQDMLDGKF